MTTPEPHECSFPEEREPSGRLILAPCLICGLSALDAMKLVKDRLAAAEARAGEAESKYAVREAFWEADLALAKRYLAERDSAQAALETTRLNLQAAVIAFSESQAALAEMREALRKYARHRASCELTDVSGEGPCICGLDAALRSPEARTQGEGT